jgi:hypothetical protein
MKGDLLDAKTLLEIVCQRRGVKIRVQSLPPISWHQIYGCVTYAR